MQEQVNITVPVNKICLVYADGLMNPARKFDIYPVQKKVTGHSKYYNHILTSVKANNQY